MAEIITANKMQQALNFAYDKAVNGVAGLDSAIDLAESYKNDNYLHVQCNSLIRWQNIKAGTSGFVTGLGGALLMPVTLPVNITSVLYIQIRMIAAIAHLAGYDLKNDKVKTMVYVCLVGDRATEILKDAGKKLGKQVAMNSIKNISGKVITQINQKVGFRLVTKFGEKGVLNLGKVVPVLGGVIGGTIDIASTNIIGNFARDTFLGRDQYQDVGTDEANTITLEELDRELSELLSVNEYRDNFVKAKIIVREDYSYYVDIYFYFPSEENWIMTTLDPEQEIIINSGDIPPLEIDFTL